MNPESSAGHEGAGAAGAVPAEGAERAATGGAFGRSHHRTCVTCVTFDNRVNVSPVDATLATSLAASLKKQCPKAGIKTVRVDMDPTARRFDTQYFKDVVRGRGLLTSDQSLVEDVRTKQAVHSNLGAEFYRNFGKATMAMSEIEIELTGSSGEIRRHFSRVN